MHQKAETLHQNNSGSHNMVLCGTYPFQPCLHFPQEVLSVQLL